MRREKAIREVITRKRGATWLLPVRLTQKGADWANCSFLMQIKASPTATEILKEITPEPTVDQDEQGRATALLPIRFEAVDTAQFPLGKLYADLRVTRETGDVQYPVEWLITNRISITTPV